jgi:hypothetical protein
MTERNIKIAKKNMGTTTFCHSRAGENPKEKQKTFHHCETRSAAIHLLRTKEHY